MTRRYAIAADIAEQFSPPVAYRQWADIRSSVPASQGLYAITDGPDGRLLYIGGTPRNGTVRSRLNAHAPGGNGRNGSNAHMIAGDLMVLPHLTPSQVRQVAESTLNVGNLVNDLVRSRWWIRWRSGDGLDDRALIRRWKPLLNDPQLLGRRVPWAPDQDDPAQAADAVAASY